MPKATTKFVCQQCGFESVKWMGRCPDCGAWNALVETLMQPARAGADGRKGGIARPGAAVPTPLSQVQTLRDARRATGSAELDRVLGGGLVPGSLVLFGGEPGIGKCLTGDMRVLDPVSGAFLPIVEWAESQYSVLTLDETTHCLSPHSVSAFHDQGVRPIIEVKTRLGRTLRCTPNHPVLTPDGWRAVGEVSPGSHVAAPRTIPFFGSEAMIEEEIKLIAYVLADGLAQSNIVVTNAIPEVEADLQEIAAYFGMTVRVYPKANNGARDYQLVLPHGQRSDARAEIAAALRHIQAESGMSWTQWAQAASVNPAMIHFWRRGECVPSHTELQRLADAANVPLSALAPKARNRAELTTPVARLLESVGLRFSAARTKAIPQCIFYLPREQMAIFLRTLFTCDGSVYVNRQGQPGISYSTFSLHLVQDVQHLLLRFGFITKLRTKPMQVNEEPYTAYEIQLLGVAQVKRFLSEIGIWGREEAKATIDQLPMPSIPTTQSDTIPTGTACWDHVHEVTGGASLKAMSRTVGTVFHPSRPDRPLCRSTVAAIVDAYPSPHMQKLAHSDVYWDEIETITPAGEERVYDLTVSGAANFVANDLIVHNSSLLLQVAGQVGLHDGEVLYVSAEESAQQVKLRAERFGIATDRLLLLAETDVDAVVEAVERMQPALVVVDSIQTVATAQVVSAPGSISQVRESTLRLMQVAKRLHVPICIIGHVTKEGTVAGPRTLEHIVDAVLYLEGERFHTYRLLRGVKNRFGATNEVGVFEMCGDGMLDVTNPSGLFLTERRGQDSGAAVVVSMEGTRPLLVEVQALATTTAFGVPRVTANGVDRNRLLMLMAVLVKRVGMALGNQDVYVNVAGGFALDEPAVDLGVAVAVASSFTERRVAAETVLLGEIGLGGELRPVPRTDVRIREAAKLGFARCVLPKTSPVGDLAGGQIELLRARTVKEAIEITLE
jgi:DNA repair protein RadA/Sms